MALQPANSKAALIAELDRARVELSRNMEGIRRDINVPAHFRNSVRHNKTAWLSGAAGLGLLFALPGRKKKVYVDRRTHEKVQNATKGGIALGLAKMAFSAAKPAIMAFVTKKISDVSRRQGKKEAVREGETYS